MQARWRRLRGAVDAERVRLEAQLRALGRVRQERQAASRGQAGELPAAPSADTPLDTPGAVEENTLVAEARVPGQRWWRLVADPPPRATAQSSLVRYRSAETKRFLGYLRRLWYADVVPRADRVRSEQQRLQDGKGSVFSGRAPTSALEPSVTQLDHTVAQSWLPTKLLVEMACAAEDINNTVLVPG